MADPQTSSIFSRKVINLFAGMAYGAPGLPRVLVDAEYKCHSIELTFAVDFQEVIRPEVVLYSLGERHTLVADAKSGKNIDCSQLERYGKVSSESLSANAFVPKPASERYDCVYVGLMDNLERNMVGIGKVPHVRVVLLCVNERGVSKQHGNFSTEKLEDAFSDHLQVDWEQVPFTFFPLDAESADWEFAQLGLAELVAKILSGQEEATIEQIMASCIPEWEQIDGEYQDQLQARMGTVIGYAAGTTFSKYLKVAPGSSAKAKIWTLTAPESKPNAYSDPSIPLHAALRSLMEKLDSGQQIMPFPPALKE